MAGHVEPPAWVSALLASFSRELVDHHGVVAVYAHGSLATGDYADDISDLDLVAITDGPVTRPQVRALTRLHRRMAADRRVAELHCCYAHRSRLTELSRRHPTWTHEGFLHRPLSAIARAELLAGGLVLAGPAPDTMMPPVPTEVLQAEVRDEVDGYWRRAAGRRRIWLQDVWVDIGLTSMIRAAAVLADGHQISKAEAIARLPAGGVPAWVVRDITDRRAGVPSTLSPEQRARRARAARDAMQRLVAELTG